MPLTIACFTLAGLIAGLSTQAIARPVSYQGGWTVIAENDRQTSSLLFHYTPDPKFSVGLKTERDRTNNILFNGVQGTWLAKRWFTPNSQANLYFFGALGAAEGTGPNPFGTKAAGQIGVMADWETRRWFVSYRARAQDYGDLDASAMQAARLGWAPYEGDTGDLHSWLMVEVDHRPDAENAVDVTPLVRFFKGAALLELGYSLEDDEPMLNFQYRF